MSGMLKPCRGAKAPPVIERDGEVVLFTLVYLAHEFLGFKEGR